VPWASTPIDNDGEAAETTADMVAQRLSPGQTQGVLPPLEPTLVHVRNFGPARFTAPVSLAARINAWADTLIGRSDWQNYPPRKRWIYAAAFWLLGLVTAVLTMFLLDAPLRVSLVLEGVLGAWVGLMLVAYVTNSTMLMRVALWGIGALALTPFAIAIGMILMTS
jgi:hypothetical protein